MVYICQFNICIMEAAAGSKSEGPTQTLQNRVRDAFRRGLQWKWERDAGPTFSGHKESERHGELPQGHELTDSSTQRHWPTFAPIAIQKFRRLFSTDSANNASCEQGLDNDSEGKSHSVAPCSKNIRKENTREGKMVRMKAKDIKSGEKVTSPEFSEENQFADHISSVPAASVQFDSLNQSSKEESQDCISLCPSKMEENPVEVSGTVKSHSLNLKSIVGEIKASDDENISVNKDCVSTNQSIVCDVVKGKSPIAIAHGEKESDALDSFSNDVKKPERVSGSLCAPSDMVTICETDVKNLDLMSNNLKDNSANQYLDDDSPGPSLALASSNSVISSKNESISTSMAMNTKDARKASIQKHKKLLEPLYLNINSASSAGPHARKSPVTVQEWVDSIPISSHLDDDPEDANTDGDLSLTAPETQIGNVCPSVTLRPAPGSGATVADQRREAFSRDASPSLQSDTGSHASSVDSYLEARRPDPEEVLLGLGFGGSLHAKEAEVSRIPARFLQPSQVKGVAIDDFLRYQQDLIETFESGYSGYRGLTGGAQVPSVIVAKIMEKLREHERESSTKSSAGSSPGHHADISRRRFSRAAHRVTILAKMKSRDSLTSSAPAHSVLNPDNRKFLDNQGSKSPEISRKRMIIGHRSFTFDGDGQLIEAEANPLEVAHAEPIVPSKPPLPRPLVHKDSVLSSATSLSLTSYDSDSDTDEAGGADRITNEAVGDKNNCEPQLSQNTSISDTNENLSLSPVMANVANNGVQNAFDKKKTPLPVIPDLVLSLNENVSVGLKTSTPIRCISWKDLHQVNSAPSTPLVDAPTPIPALWTHAEESSSGSEPYNHKNGKLQEYLKQRNQSALQNNPELLASLKAYSKIEPEQTPSPNARQSSFYKISDFVLPDDCTSSLDSPESQSSLPADAQQLQRMCSMPKSSSMFLDKELRRKLSLNSSVDSYIARSVAHSPDLKNWSTSSVSSWESEKDFSPKLLVDKILNEEENPVFDEQTVAITHEPEVDATVNRRRGSLKRQKKVDEEDLLRGTSSSSNLNVNRPNIATDQGDSFEMEELSVEEEIRGARTGSAHSDSSGFQEEPNQNKPSLKAALGKQLSQSEPMLCTKFFPEELAQIQVDPLKRLSLPVIRIQDESGLTQWHATSICQSDEPVTSSLRRVQSLPCQLSRLGLRRLSECFSPGSMTDSIGNMFSSCSDESVIHVPRTSIDVTAEEQPEVSPLPAAILDYEGEVEALRAPRECCKCHCSLKNSLSKCHSDLLLSQENDQSFSNISSSLKTLKEAQNEINNVVQQMQNHSCLSFGCKMKDTLEQVASVVYQQNSLCLLLEGFSSDLLSTIKNLSAQSMSEDLHSTHNTLNTPNIPKKTLKEVSSSPLHSSENCVTLCRIVEKENRRLQELVQMNVDELARIRLLLETLLQNSKV
ncbi:uncharacterized protein LOC117650245 isoform X2 [Thrips palmi]|uniref:Uncharacterized protein LOC117650245 isoform X2 n=1 Tax=Thrips palmi TaxID=161013 RepID=A0A6P8ZVN3_THRPL|nr:uncharacterized protein LOC117650245 isoform X2 [Thrips palmi]